MVTKKSAPKSPTANKVEAAPKKETATANMVLASPSVHAAVGMEAWGKFAGAVDLGGLVEDVQNRVKKVQAGEMGTVEAMLYGQAMTLQTMFTSLARRAAGNEGLKQFQVNLTLALKAQAQCRSTLEALAEIKNPRPVSFVKQANVSNGPQQVNNTYASASAHSDIASGAENFQSEPNKLLEADHGQRMDIGAQGAAGRADPHLEAVGAVHRA